MKKQYPSILQTIHKIQNYLNRRHYLNTTLTALLYGLLLASLILALAIAYLVRTEHYLWPGTWPNLNIHTLSLLLSISSNPLNPWQDARKILLLCLLLGLLWALYKRYLPFQAALIADKQLGLKDRLSTCFEILHHSPNLPQYLQKLILQEVQQKIQQWKKIPLPQIQRPPISKRWLAIPPTLLLLLSLLDLSSQLQPPTPLPQTNPLSKIEKISQDILQLSQEIEQEAKKKHNLPALKLASELKQIASELKKNPSEQQAKKILSKQISKLKQNTSPQKQKPTDLPQALKKAIHALSQSPYTKPIAQTLQKPNPLTKALSQTNKLLSQLQQQRIGKHLLPQKLPPHPSAPLVILTKPERERIWQTIPPQKQSQLLQHIQNLPAFLQLLTPSEQTLLQSTLPKTSLNTKKSNSLQKLIQTFPQLSTQQQKNLLLTLPTQPREKILTRLEYNIREQFFKKLSPAEQGQLLQILTPQKRLKLWKLLPPSIQPLLYPFMEPNLQKNYLSNLPLQQALPLDPENTLQTLTKKNKLHLPHLSLKQKETLLLFLSKKKISQLLQILNPSVKKQILNTLSPQEAKQLLPYLTPKEIQQALLSPPHSIPYALDFQQRNQLLQILNSHLKQKILHTLPIRKTKKLRIFQQKNTIMILKKHQTQLHIFARTKIKWQRKLSQNEKQQLLKATQQAAKALQNTPLQPLGKKLQQISNFLNALPKAIRALKQSPYTKKIAKALEKNNPHLALKKTKKLAKQLKNITPKSQKKLFQALRKSSHALQAHPSYQKLAQTLKKLAKKLAKQNSFQQKKKKKNSSNPFLQKMNQKALKTLQKALQKLQPNPHYLPPSQLKEWKNLKSQQLQQPLPSNRPNSGQKKPSSRKNSPSQKIYQGPCDMACPFAGQCKKCPCRGRKKNICPQLKTPCKCRRCQSLQGNQGQNSTQQQNTPQQNQNNQRSPSPSSSPKNASQKPGKNGKQWGKGHDPFRKTTPKPHQSRFKKTKIRGKSSPAKEEFQIIQAIKNYNDNSGSLFGNTSILQKIYRHFWKQQLQKALEDAIFKAKLPFSQRRLVEKYFEDIKPKEK
ncbi:MAG: hypothetical protein D6805_05900 [Planctomycetota bacterium]|nr:MAG: hypothetical protein D6805_05900 [Planctomycetota bacterium]